MWMTKMRELQRFQESRWNPYPDRIPACTDTFTKKLGIPCLHKIKDILEAGGHLRVEDFNPF